MAAPDLTVRSLAVAMRLHGDVNRDPAEPLRSVLAGLHAATSAILGAQNLDDSIPAPVSNEVIVRLSAYLYAAPPGIPGGGFAQVWRNSGCATLVEPWRNRKFEIVGDADGASTSVSGEGGDPVTGFERVGEEVTITVRSGETFTVTLPSGGVASDVTARDAAAAAQAAADAAATAAATAQARADLAYSEASTNAGAIGARLTQAQVDARVQALIDAIPAPPSPTSAGANVAAGVSADDTPIPNTATSAATAVTLAEVTITPSAAGKNFLIGFSIPVHITDPAVLLITELYRQIGSGAESQVAPGAFHGAYISSDAANLRTLASLTSPDPGGPHDTTDPITYRVKAYKASATAAIVFYSGSIWAMELSS